MSSPVEKVLVTGASGYLASHVVKLMLEQGYKVRGTVRSLQNESKVKPLKELQPAENLELVEADLLDSESILRAVEGCSHVLHVASPFPMSDPKTEDELLKPAVEGTRSVLEACKQHKVKRVVVTSSLIAMLGDWATAPEGVTCSEKDWASMETKEFYAKSKLLAEKEAWDFVEKMPEKDRLELVVLNPSFIQGPTLVKGDATSFYFVKAFLERELPLIPNLNFCCCDVRNVAAAFLPAMLLPEVVGKRFIINTGSYWLKDFATILDKEFRKMGYNVPTTSCPNFLLKVIAWFDPKAAKLAPAAGRRFCADNTRMVEELKITPIEFEKTIIDMAYSLIEKGVVYKTSLYKPRDEE